MKELGISKGGWYKDSTSQYVFVDKGKIDIEICKVDHPIHNTDYRTKEESANNATLIADAGNTAQKCGLLPSELLKQRDELREALKQIRDTTIFVRKGSMDAYKMQHIVEAAIKSTER